MTLLHETLQLNADRDFTALFLIETTLRVTALLLLAIGVIAVCRRVSAATRHRLWMLTVGGTLALPIISLAVPHMNLALPRAAKSTWTPARVSVTPPTIPPAKGPLLSVADDLANQTPLTPVLKNPAKPLPEVKHSAIAIKPTLRASARAWRWGTIILYGWLVGAATVALLSIVSLLSANQLVRRAPLVTDPDWLELHRQLADKIGLRNTVELRCCDRRISPMTWGLMRPVILLPLDCDAWTNECRRAVLLHELAHIQRRDWPAQMLTQLAAVIYWFHPLIWLATREVRKESDRAADDFALNAGLSATTYAEQLLHVAGNMASAWLHPAPTMARQSQLGKRITLLLDTRRKRGTMSRKGSMMANTLTVCLVLVTALVSVTTAEDSKKAIAKQKPATKKHGTMTAAREQIEQALRKTGDFDFADTPLTEAMATIGKNYRVNIAIDESALTDEGISTDTPVTLQLKNVTLDFALRMFLEPLQMEAVIRNEVLQITTLIGAWELFETRVYDLEEFLGIPASTIDKGMLHKVITTTISPDSWGEVGGPGPGVIAGVRRHRKLVHIIKNDGADLVPVKPLPKKTALEGLPGIMIIRQKQTIHREIQSFFKELRSQLVPTEASQTTREKNAAAIRKALPKTFNGEFQDTPLSQGDCAILGSLLTLGNSRLAAR